MHMYVPTQIQSAKIILIYKNEEVQQIANYCK